MDKALAARLPPSGPPLVKTRFTPSYLFHTLFSNEHVTSWLLSKETQPPTTVTPDMMKSSITTDTIILGSPSQASKFFQKAGILFQDSAARSTAATTALDADARVSGPCAAVEKEENMANMTVHMISPTDSQIDPNTLRPLFRFPGVEKLVFLCHSSSPTHCFLSVTDTRTPFSFLEKPGIVVPGVRRAVGIYTEFGFMLAVNYWFQDDRSNLKVLNYIFNRDRDMYCEIHIILLKPYPSFRYPNESDILETIALVEQKDCEFCLCRGYAQCQCTLPMIRRRRPAFGQPPIDQRNPWIMWKWLWSTYDSGLKKYCSNITNYTTHFRCSTVGLNLVRPTFLNHDQDEHINNYQYYLNIIRPCFTEKLLEWGRVQGFEERNLKRVKRTSVESDEFGPMKKSTPHFGEFVPQTRFLVDPMGQDINMAQDSLVRLHVTSTKTKTSTKRSRSPEACLSEMLPVSGSGLESLGSKDTSGVQEGQRSELLAVDDKQIAGLSQDQDQGIFIDDPEPSQPFLDCLPDSSRSQLAGLSVMASDEVPPLASAVGSVNKASVNLQGKDESPGSDDERDELREPEAVQGIMEEDRKRFQEYLQEVEGMTWVANARSLCRFCSNSFARKHDLKRHIRSQHLGEASHLCSICGNRYRRNYHLDVHIKIVHEKSLSFPCPHCYKVYSADSSRKKHIKKSHCEASKVSPLEPQQQPPEPSNPA